jgi:hypothetical protein
VTSFCSSLLIIDYICEKKKEYETFVNCKHHIFLIQACKLNFLNQLLMALPYVLDFK